MLIVWSVVMFNAGAAAVQWPQLTHNQRNGATTLTVIGLILIVVFAGIA